MHIFNPVGAPDRVQDQVPDRVHIFQTNPGSTVMSTWRRSVLDFQSPFVFLTKRAFMRCSTAGRQAAGFVLKENRFLSDMDVNASARRCLHVSDE